MAKKKTATKKKTTAKRPPKIKEVSYKESDILNAGVVYPPKSPNEDPEILGFVSTIAKNPNGTPYFILERPSQSIPESNDNNNSKSDLPESHLPLSPPKKFDN